MVLDTMTAEVNQKVKNAIKAKLNELGVYVDDELPDYIMILVGNRKTKDQMDDDLSLFLGHNTERFTSWLHDVLQRLNAASALQTDTKADTKADTKVTKEKKKEDEEEKVIEPEETKVEEKKKHKKKKDKSEKKKEKKEKKKKKDKDKDKEKHSKRKHKEKSKSKSPVELNSAEKLVETNVISDSSLSPSKKEDNSHLNGSKVSTKSDVTGEPNSYTQIKDDDVPSDVVNLRPNAEDLALDFEDEPPTKKFKTKLVSKELKNKDQGSPNTPPQTITSIEIQVDNPRAKELPVRSFSDDEDATSEVSSSGTHEKLLSKRVINLREESTFPPRSSSEGIGRVVSNAIASAVKSVSLGGGGVTGKKLEARVRPLISSRKVIEEEEEEVDDVALPPGRLTSTVGAVLKRCHSNSNSDNEEPPPKRLSGVASKVEVTPRPRRPGSVQANTALILRAVADAHKSVNKPSRKILEEKEEERGNRKEIFTRSYQERQNQRLSSSAEGKTRPIKKFAITVPNALLKDNVEMKISRKSDLDETGDEDLEMDDKQEVRIKSKILPQEKASTNKVIPMQVDESSRNTRFIVTLDGFGNEVIPSADLRSKIKGRAVRTPSVEEEEFIEEEVEEEWEEEEVVEEIDVVPTQTVGAERVTPTTGAATKWKAKIDASGLGVKKEERCIYWPSCKEGNACQYIHPSIPCSVFPNCKFRDECIYIHPNCKFGATCAKLNCPFMHTSSRNPGLLYPTSVKGMIANPAKMMIKCKFYPKCKDMNCLFMHPSILCRFGRLCPNKLACMFVHPETGHSMKWEASKSAVKKVPPAGSASVINPTIETSTTAV